jgi:hypothetical protein
LLFAFPDRTALRFADRSENLMLELELICNVPLEYKTEVLSGVISVLKLFWQC